MTLAILFAVAIRNLVRYDRQLRETIKKIERDHGRAAALKLEARMLATWNDRKLARIYAELERIEGAVAVLRLKEEVQGARLATFFLFRPLRLLHALAIGLPLLALVTFFVARLSDNG